MHPAPLKSRPYGAIQIRLLLLLDYYHKMTPLPVKEWRTPAMQDSSLRYDNATKNDLLRPTTTITSTPRPAAAAT